MPPGDHLSRERTEASPLLLVLIGVLIGLVTFPSTTGAAEVVYAYDTPTIARVDDRAFATAEIASALLKGVRDESASPPVDGSGPSTTPSFSFVATNTVDDLLSSGRQVSGRFPQAC